jgi:GxxExxY protein
MLDGETQLTDRVIGYAMEVHTVLGPGLPESAYEAALCIELRTGGVPFQRQIGIPLYYKGELLSEHRPDLVIDDRLVVEIKSIERFAPVHRAQMLTYLRITELGVGLILNFNTDLMKNGIKRVVRQRCAAVRPAAGNFHQE